MTESTEQLDFLVVSLVFLLHLLVDLRLKRLSLKPYALSRIRRLQQWGQTSDQTSTTCAHDETNIYNNVTYWMWKDQWEGMRTILTNAASQSPCIWDAFDTLCREIDRICADFFFDNSEARHFTRSFQHCQFSCHLRGFRGLTVNQMPQSESAIDEDLRYNFWNHTSSIFFPLPSPWSPTLTSQQTSYQASWMLT